MFILLCGLPAPRGYWRRQQKPTDCVLGRMSTRYIMIVLNESSNLLQCISECWYMCGGNRCEAATAWCNSDTRLVWLLSPPRLSRRFNRSRNTYTNSRTVQYQHIYILLITIPFAGRTNSCVFFRIILLGIQFDTSFWIKKRMIAMSGE